MNKRLTIIQLMRGKVDPGLVSSFALIDDEREEGMILLCCTKPLSDLVIEEGEL